MNTDNLSHSRRSFLKQFTGALMIAGTAGMAGAKVAPTNQILSGASEPVAAPIARGDDDTGCPAYDDMSDPGWSY